MRVADIVTIDDVNDTPGVIEEVYQYAEVTVYAVRSAYTGIRYAREAHELTPASEELAARTRLDMRLLAELR